MEQKRFWKVKYGFTASDQVSIEEGGELEKAIYAQLKGVPVQLGNSFVNGRNIISISPHYHKYTGWYDYYEPTTGDDFAQIKRDCPSFDGHLELYKERVSYLLQNNQTSLIGKNVNLPNLNEVKQLENRGPISNEVKALANKFRIDNK